MFCLQNWPDLYLFPFTCFIKCHLLQLYKTIFKPSQDCSITWGGGGGGTHTTEKHLAKVQYNVDGQEL